jgi:hypothetical protein
LLGAGDGVVRLRLYMYGILQAYVPVEGCITRDLRQTPADYRNVNLEIEKTHVKGSHDQADFCSITLLNGLKARSRPRNVPPRSVTGTRV